jgi:glycosyltransferase involved in cell wall biosynthesis
MATLQSVLGQDCGDWELIIKDGGSSQSSLEAIPLDPRIRIIRSPDQGVFDAMNQSLEHVRGDWVCFLNAGDSFSHRSALAVILEHARHDECAEFIYCDVAKPTSRSGFEKYPDQLGYGYLFSNMICHQAWFLKSAYYRRTARYETKEISGADRRFLLRMVLVYRVQYRHVPMVLITYKGGGISQRQVVHQRAAAWIDELVRELYTAEEYRKLHRRYRVRTVAKRWLYDTGVWRILRLFRSIRAHRDSAVRLLLG